MTALLFLRSYWKLILGGLLVAAFAVQTIRLEYRTAQLERAKVNLNECRAGREADRAAYREAQARAAEMNRAEVERIETEQQRITENVESNLGARLERLRRELRAKASQGSAASPEAGEVPDAPESAPGGARLCLAPDQLLRGAENEERHHQLIEWVKQQLGVER